MRPFGAILTTKKKLKVNGKKDAFSITLSFLVRCRLGKLGFFI
tara:strand:+ start:197 stop:325 length:129 start_codon:yes stop_codon:yes gene_type:complete